MPRDLLQFSPRVGPEPVRKADVVVAALPLLRKLADRLALAIEFAERVRQQTRSSGEPPLFFSFHSPSPTVTPFADSPEAIAVARRRPDLAAAWSELGELLDDAFMLAASEANVRHAARAVPQLRERLDTLATLHDRCRHFRGLLDVVDDEAVVVLIPHELRGWRFLVRGIANLGQFHLLFADYLPAARPDARLADACRFEPVDPECGTATAKFQFYAPPALQPDGTVPHGFAGSEHWQWEHQPLRAMPCVNGERVLLAGPPAYTREWLVGRKFAAVPGEVELLEVMPEEAVRNRLKELGATELSEQVERMAA